MVSLFVHVHVSPSMSSRASAFDTRPDQRHCTLPMVSFIPSSDFCEVSSPTAVCSVMQILCGRAKLVSRFIPSPQSVGVTLRHNRTPKKPFHLNQNPPSDGNQSHPRKTNTFYVYPICRRLIINSRPAINVRSPSTSANYLLPLRPGAVVLTTPPPNKHAVNVCIREKQFDVFSAHCDSMQCIDNQKRTTAACDDPQ